MALAEYDNDTEILSKAEVKVLKDVLPLLEPVKEAISAIKYVNSVQQIPQLKLEKPSKNVLLLF